MRYVYKILFQIIFVLSLPRTQVSQDKWSLLRAYLLYIIVLETYLQINSQLFIAFLQCVPTMKNTEEI